VGRETAVARKPVEDSERAIKQEQENIRNADSMGLATRKPKKTFEEMVKAIRESLRNRAYSDIEDDREDNVDDEKIQSWAI
jgi:hypothetical protein